MNLRNGEAISQLVRETLSSLMSPELQDRVMARALALGGYDRVPPDVGLAMEWVRSSLSTAISETVSPEAAELVIEQLAPRSTPREEPRREPPPEAESRAVTHEPLPLLRHDPKRPLPRLPPMVRDDKTVPPPRRPTDNALLSDLPSVLFSTSAAPDVRTLTEVVRGRASVQHIESLAVLLESLADPGLSHPVLLIDGQRSPVSSDAILAIGADLPQGTMIVLWGGAHEAWSGLADGYAGAARVFRCSREATARDLAAFCLMLLS